MNFLYLIVFLIYVFIPIFIIVNIFNTLEDEIKKIRFKYSIPSIITTIINIIILIYIIIVGKIPILEENPYLLFIPLILIIICMALYKAGKKQEKIIELNIASQEIESVRFKRSDIKRQNLSVSFNEEDEKL